MQNSVLGSRQTEIKLVQCNPLMSSILITGGSGLLAINWATRIGEFNSVTLGIHHRKITIPYTQSICVDLESVKQIRQTLDKLAVDTVIHTAAVSNIEKCEQEPQLAEHINVELANNVAQAAREHGARFVHISTDHLFDGIAPMRTEDDPISPLNVYARTKGEAEHRVLAACPDALVIRTNFYGWGTAYRSSFSDGILATLNAGQSVMLFEDVYYTPILIDVLVDAVQKLLSAAQTGIFNIVGDQRISKFDFGCKLATVFGFDPALIRRNRLSERKDLTLRPFDMSLSNRKAVGVLGGSLGSAEEHLILLREASKRPLVSPGMSVA